MPITWNPTKWIDSLIEQRMHAAGQAMVAVAKAFVAVDTGDLQKSIGCSYDAQKKVLTLYATEPCAIHQEFGTYRMRPHPFLRPAINAFAPAFFTGAITGVSVSTVVGSSLKSNHTPRKILPHIKPHIVLANRLHDTAATRRAGLPPWLHQNVGQPQGSKLRRIGGALVKGGLIAAAGAVVVGGVAAAVTISSLSRQSSRRKRRRR